MSDVLYGVQYDPNSLQHYGVLGMRWGVRKNPSRAYSKATRKADRLSTKASKLEKSANDGAWNTAKAKHKSQKLGKKAAKLQRKANKAFRSGNTTKAAHLQSKANKYTRKKDKIDATAANTEWVAAKKRRKAQKTRKRYDKWLDAMQREFGVVKLEDIDPEIRERGRQYLHMLRS